MKQILLLDAGGNSFTKKERIFYFLFLLFFLTLYNPFWTILNNISMWLIFVYSFFFNSPAEKWQLLKQRKAISAALLFFLLNVASTFLLSSNVNAGVSWIGIRIALFALPLAIGTVQVKPELKERMIYCFAALTTLAAMGCFLWGLYRYGRLHDTALLYNDSLTDIIHLQSIYFAMLVNLAIFSYTWLWVKGSSFLNKNITVITLFFLLLVHFLLASRAAILILYSSILVFSLVYLARHRKFLEGITLVMGLAIGGFLLVKFFPKTINRFKELGYTQFNYNNNGPESHYNMAITVDQWNGANIRLAVWECGWTAIQQHPWLGVGLGDKVDALQQQYAERHFEFGIKTNRNMHNNYLDVWQSMGLVGLAVFFFAFLILPLAACIKTSDWWGIMVIISFALSLVSETYMDRTVGNELLGLFFGFLAAYKINPTNT